ncbi:thiamine-phosphate pyrophosphorylase [Ectothiorhodospira magna]|uniref:Thiamine-phosphate synthase n=1 Tax=Ectothiorhodospira magna TaxID=867345 RepID=A0A1H9FV97_9GAMM|nr:thiamine phosphate synthase [Ectothiorhodospira magna]SEQ41784.1 thiamine-phosphate pyrophosphorylase [Ectothiorhodospira magna]
MTTPPISRQSRLHGLYVITPQDAGDTLLEQAAAALTGGARILQYRDKSRDHDRRLAQAQALCRLCRDHQALFIVNDDAALAARVEADGVHIGSDDGDIATARALVGPERIIGVSCYNRLELARRAEAAGADYVAFGALFPSGTKPGAVHAPLSLIREARQSLAVPITAIGGITQDNADRVIQAGAHMLAVIQGVFSAPDIRAAAADLSARF